MFTRSTARILAQSIVSTSHARPAARLLPRVAPSVVAVRSFTSTTVAANAATEEASSPSESKDKEDFNQQYRLTYILHETIEPTQQSLISQITDEQLAHLPIVTAKRAKTVWRPMENGITLPIRNRDDDGSNDFSPIQCGEYLYITYPFASTAHLDRFMREVANRIDGEYRTVSPVMLFDSRSRTLTIGLPSYIGIQPPYPAKDNMSRVITMIKQFRSDATPAVRKQILGKQLRAWVIPRGFRSECHLLSLYLQRLYETIKNASREQIVRNQLVIASNGELAEEATSTARQAREKKEPRSRSASTKREVSQAARVNEAAEVKLPDAGVSVAREGSASASRKKESSLAGRLREAAEARAAEATAFVAQDGGAHKGNDKEADGVQEHVPLPNASAEGTWMAKPDTAQADDPRLPEAGTFVAEDGDAHKGTENEADGLQEHVPFPNPTAQEMGIKKPTEN